MWRIFSADPAFSGELLMPFMLRSLQSCSVLLCVALLVALIAPASASAGLFGRNSVSRPQSGESLDILLDTVQDRHWRESLIAAGVKRTIWSHRREREILGRSVGEIEPGLARGFRGRWTKLGLKLRQLTPASQPPTSSVPEPSTAVLMMLGLSGLAGSARRMRSGSSDR